ncbi:MAG: hypothetical protein PW789_18680 [Edaphobacter sp.]|uniref:ArnT family glycosyltransferase n=1 Tax=Edaphobacter sp. TaxID=1934404 RepID=UPI00238D0E03|nr:hypothetical protein [Edaphobacter sp.]MDE1178605.1 hypothetical protein [Edaphobacter sp.]
MKLERLWAWMKAGDDSEEGSRRLRWRLFWVGLAIRILYILVVRPYHVRPLNDHFQFGWEAGRIARALVTGYGYADPFTGHSGPTAWLAPLYPLLMAAVFKVFGVYTALSAFVLLAINSVLSAAMAPAIYEIAHRCYDSRGLGRRVALWSGWIWTLYPAAMQYAVRWFWEMSLTTCAFTWIIVIALRLRRIGEDDESQRHNDLLLWSVFGLLWAAIFLANPSVILVLPVTAIWILMGSRSGSQLTQGLGRAALAGVLFLACVTPWVYRNWVVFHAFIPTRGNLGAEMYQSMLPSNEAFSWGTTIPAEVDAPEYKRYRQMGELAYVRERNVEANALIAANHGRFVRYAIKRVYFFWFGVPKPEDHGILVEATRRLNYCFICTAALMGLALSLRQRVPASGLFTAIFLILPAPYYIVTVQARFRHPIEPIMTVLIVFLFQSATSSKKQSPSHEATGALAR